MFKKNTKLAVALCFGAIIALALFLRFWQLDTVPNGIHPDAAANAIDAYNANVNNDYKIFFEANNGREGLFINIIAFFMRIFGYNLFAYKLAGVFTGVFIVIGMYFLGKEAGQRKLTGLFASFLAATSFWLIIFERTGFRAVSSVLMMVWASYFFLRGFRRNKWYEYAISGLFVGAGLHTYIPMRFVPVIFLAVIVYHIFLEVKLDKESLKKSIKDNLKFFWLVPTSLLTAAPILIYFYQHPEFLIGRSNEVSVFSQPHSLLLLFVSTFSNLGMFFFYGDPNWRHNFSTEPVLNALEGMFFIAGCVLMLRYIFQRHQKKSSQEALILKTNYFFTALLFFFMMIPACISYSPGGIPHALRAIDAAPAVFLAIAIALTMAFDKIKKHFGAKIVVLLIVLFVSYTSINIFIKYFYRWGINNQVRHEFSEDFTNLSSFINERAKSGERIIIVGSNIEIEFFTIENPDLLRLSEMNMTIIRNFNPDLVIFSDDQESQSEKYFSGYSWKKIEGMNFGKGSHYIKIFEKIN